MPATWELLVAGLLAAQSTAADPQAAAPVLKPQEQVEVTDNRQTIRGRMVEATTDSLVLQRDGCRVSLPFAMIQRIDRVGDSLLNGTAIGAALGGGSALALMVKLCANTQCADTSANLDPRITLLGTLMGAGVGALIDAAFHARKTVYRAGAGQPAPTMAHRSPTGAEEYRTVLFARAGGARVTDDEGLLGSGATAGAGVTVMIGRQLGVQMAFDRQTRKREFELNRGSLGTEHILTTKVLYFFRSMGTIRPYAGLGMGLIDSKQPVVPSFVSGPANQVVSGPAQLLRHHTRGKSLGFAAGVDARVSARLSILGDLTLDLANNYPEGIGSTRLTVGAGWRF